MAAVRAQIVAANAVSPWPSDPANLARPCGPYTGPGIGPAPGWSGPPPALDACLNRVLHNENYTPLTAADTPFFQTVQSQTRVASGVGAGGPPMSLDNLTPSAPWLCGRRVV